MRAIPLKTWLLAGLSAGLQIAMFPTGGPMPPWRSAISWLALIPFLVALLANDKAGKRPDWKASVLLGYSCGVVWYFGNCFWIYQTMYLYGGLPKPVSFGILTLFSLYLGLYHALFAGLFAIVRRSRAGINGALLAVPFLWVAVELARGRVTGFPWDLLGNAQVGNYFVTRIAPVAGVMGISFLVAAINAAMTGGLVGKSRGRQVLSGMALVAGLCLQMASSFYSDSILNREPRNELAVMVQENLAVGVQGLESTPLSREEKLAIFSELSMRPYLPVGKGTEISWAAASAVTNSAGVTPRVILWPEAPADFYSTDPLFRRSAGELAKKAGLPVIAGSLGVDLDRAAPRGYYKFDSASLFDTDGNYAGRYDKIHLVPWGEYVPYKAIFSFAQKLTAGAGDMDPGRLRTVFEASGHRYGVFICYESIFGDEVREFAKNGAEVLVNLSDDGWYGETGAPWQHLNMARMRAIENHRWVLRATNTGVTTAIDPWGRVPVEAPRHVRAAFAFRFAFEQGTTFYTRHGDWFAYVCAAVALVAVGLGYWKRASPG